MTQPDDTTIRRMVDDARAVVEAIAALPAAAPADDERARDWARFRLESAEQRWDGLQAAVAAGDPRRFTTAVHALISQSVPLQDAPPSLVPAADAALARTNQLAVDKQSVIDPHIADGDIAAPAAEAISAALRRIAASG